MAVAKLCRKPPQLTMVPLGMGDVFSDRIKVAAACSSCIKKKKKKYFFMWVDQYMEYMEQKLR